MRAVVLERNPLVARKVVRYLASVGIAATAVEDPALVAWEGVQLVCADAFDGELVATAVRERRVRGLLWTSEPLRHALRYVDGGIDHILARRDFDSAPRAWEVVMVARRLVTPQPQRLPFAAFFDWGASQLELSVARTAERDPAIHRIEAFVAGLHVAPRVAEMFGELAHELVMNALYDAPADYPALPSGGAGGPGQAGPGEARGLARYAHDRKADVALAPHEAAHVQLGSDGTRLALRVTDPFGRLARAHVSHGLARGLAGGEVDRSGGGAGLGFTVVHNAANALFCEVTAQQRTEVTAVLDLDTNLRELRTQARSLHLWGLA